MSRRKKTEVDPTVDERGDTVDPEMDAAYAARAQLAEANAAATGGASPRARATKRQGELAGMERDGDPVLDKLAGEYTTKSAARGQLSADLKTLNAKIQQALEDRGITAYRFVDGEQVWNVTLTKSKTKVKVTEVKDEGDDGGGE